AKYRNLVILTGEYIAKSVADLYSEDVKNPVFDEDLTEEVLDSGNFTNCDSYTKAYSSTLRRSYRKFTTNTTTIYTNSYQHEKISIVEFDSEGDILETRTYNDIFDDGESSNVGTYLSDLAEEHKITNVETGEQITIEFDSSLPFTSPSNISWEGARWGQDNIPVQFDELIVRDAEGNIEYSDNYFKDTITIRIPNRYSLYNDYGKVSLDEVTDEGYASFNVTGMLVTPTDGMVYYTSDLDSFIEGQAQQQGHYFYVDTNLNSYYETVYILSDTFTNTTGIPTYDVISIGYNNDGDHKFIPYEKLPEVNNIETDLQLLSATNERFGNWYYNYGNLKNLKYLMDEVEYGEEYKNKIHKKYQPLDQIFDIYKLTGTSKNNPKFSTLFYEIRHKTYNDAWVQFEKQLSRDITEQVLLTTIASTLSAYVASAVCAAISGATMGYGTPLGMILGQQAGSAVYSLTYTLGTKIFIDLELHEAQAKMASTTYYPISNPIQEPQSLNERAHLDCFLRDSVAAAILGHPGGYYANVFGGESGNRYTAEVLVSPRNDARIERLGSGIFKYLGKHLVSTPLWDINPANPDLFVELDFDTQNLDWFLLTSELPSYNGGNEFIRFENTDHLLNELNEYHNYRYNTLGYLEGEITERSSGLFNGIKANCFNGNPYYQFVDKSSTLYSVISPKTGLYNPLVLSEERFNEVSIPDGYLVATVQCQIFDDTKGINAYNLTDAEAMRYGAKIPLNSKGFNYPIIELSLDIVLDHGDEGKELFAERITINDKYFTCIGGILYFNTSLEDIIAIYYPGFIDLLQNEYADELIEVSVYYDIHIVFKLAVPNKNDEYNMLALTQATEYALMDYFNQYTYAKVSAELIGEVGYTETLTVWSTAISLPFTILGSYLVSQYMGSGAQAGAQNVVSGMGSGLLGGLMGISQVFQIIGAPLMEAFEEVFIDSFIEALSQNIVEMTGGTEALGYWVSSGLTSVRESHGPMADISLGDIQTQLNLYLMQDFDLVQRTGLQANLQAQEQASRTSKLVQRKLLTSLAAKGIAILAGSILMGGFNIFSLGSIMDMMARALQEEKDILEQKYLMKNTILQNAKKGRIIMNGDYFEWEGDFPSSTQSEIIEEITSTMNEAFKAKQENNKVDMSLKPAIPYLNPDPRNYDSQHELASKFNEISLINFATELDIEKSALVSIFRDEIKSGTERVKGAHMLTESMYPLIQLGWVIPVDHDFTGQGYSRGDIIVVQKEGMPIPYAHIIIEKFENLEGKHVYITKGINNPLPDSGTIDDTDIIGKVMDVSRNAIKLMMHLTERGIIPKYDVLGMPSGFGDADGFNIYFSEFSYIDGQDYAKSVEQKIIDYESEIVRFLMEHKTDFKDKSRYSDELYNSIVYEIKFENGEDVSIIGFERYNGHIKDVVIAALLGIYRETYSLWLKNYKNPYEATFLKIYKHLKDHFWDLTLTKYDIELSELLLPNFMKVRQSKRTELVLRHLSATFVHGKRFFNWRDGYRKYFGYDMSVFYKNIKQEIFRLLITSTGIEIDRTIGTSREKLFEKLLNDYSTYAEKKKLADNLYYLCFGKA
ncbi:MAG: signal peptidase I, partial [Promethearchaeota archaeon]